MILLFIYLFIHFNFFLSQGISGAHDDISF